MKAAELPELWKGKTMDQPMNQPYIQPQVVVMPPRTGNALGVFGFLIALVGLFIPTGIVSLLGLVLCLAAIGRSPRGFAIFGVILGLLGSLFWLIVMIGALILGLIAAFFGAIFVAGAFMLVQPEVVEVTTDMINVAIAVQDYAQQNDEMPEEIDLLSLGVASSTDPWGKPYKLVLIDDEPGFDVISNGPDGVFDTRDDVLLSRLDHLWENACENFGEKMEEFGEKMERLQRCNSSCTTITFESDDCCPKGDYASTYEDKVRQHLLVAPDSEAVIRIEVPADTGIPVIVEPVEEPAEPEKPKKSDKPAKPKHSGKPV